MKFPRATRLHETSALRHALAEHTRTHEQAAYVAIQVAGGRELFVPSTGNAERDADDLLARQHQRLHKASSVYLIEDMTRFADAAAKMLLVHSFRPPRSTPSPSPRRLHHPERQPTDAKVRSTVDMTS